jgi:hypothetical protein
MTAKLSGRLPQGDANGLGAIIRNLIAEPEAVHVLVVLADAVKVTRLVESGDTVPTMRIRRVEAITDAGDRASLQRLMMREFERRTGQLVLPLDLENDVRAAFGDGSLEVPGADDDPDEGPADPPARRGRKR